MATAIKARRRSIFEAAMPSSQHRHDRQAHRRVIIEASGPSSQHRRGRQSKTSQHHHDPSKHGVAASPRQSNHVIEASSKQPGCPRHRRGCQSTSSQHHRSSRAAVAASPWLSKHTPSQHHRSIFAAVEAHNGRSKQGAAPSPWPSKHVIPARLVELPQPSKQPGRCRRVRYPALQNCSGPHTDARGSRTTVTTSLSPPVLRQLLYAAATPALNSSSCCCNGGSFVASKVLHAAAMHLLEIEYTLFAAMPLQAVDVDLHGWEKSPRLMRSREHDAASMRTRAYGCEV